MKRRLFALICALALPLTASTPPLLEDARTIHRIQVAHQLGGA